MSRWRQSLQFGHHRRKSDPSTNIPPLPHIQTTLNGRATPEDTEAKWEERATILAKNLASPTDLRPSGRSRAPSIASEDVSKQCLYFYYYCYYCYCCYYYSIIAIVVIFNSAVNDINFSSDL